MFVLVTQADGSARRFTWVTYAIVIALVAFFVQQRAEGDKIQEGRGEALAYLNQNPYVEVQERFRAVIPLDYARALRETFFKERRARGLALMSDYLINRGQLEFDELLRAEVMLVESQPAFRFGIRDKDTPVAAWLIHPAVHESQLALLFSVLLLLSFGIALEDAWGSIFFGCFAAAGVLATALVSVIAQYYTTTGMPWFGLSGLIATLSGASLVRSSLGSPRAFGVIPMPGWLLLPLWLAVEYFVIRGVSSVSEIATALTIVHGTGVGLGCAVAGLMLLFQIEAKMIARSGETPELVSNPVLERAMRAKESGRVEQAFELLRSEFRRSPKNRDVALALWDASIEVGKAQRVVESILSVIEKDLQTGHGGQAVAKWFAMLDVVAKPAARPQLFVRIGEVLLDQGHPDAAVAALTRGVEDRRSLTTALAQRVVRIARDLDPALTRRAAEIALRDGQLGMVEREELNRLIIPVVPDRVPEPTAAPATPANSAQTRDAEADLATAAVSENDASRAMVDANVDTIVAADLDTMVQLDDPAKRQSAALNPEEEISALDPQALSLDDLEEELFKGLTEDSEAQELWNNPGMIDGIGDGIDDEIADGINGDFEGDIFGDTNHELGDELEFESQSAHAANAETIAPRSGSADDTVTEVNVESLIPVWDERELETEIEIEDAPTTLAENDSVTTTATDIVPTQRCLQIREALPVTFENESLVIEVVGGNKTRLPYARIDALATAAVHGLGEKPVVVVDLVVNWLSASEPLKIIRLRGDRFDPAQLDPGSENQLAALRKLLCDLIRVSNATPLPNFNAATGSPFQVFASLAEYHREVLDGIEDPNF